MQTFLPFPSFKDSIKVIDNKRLWKQYLEAKQLISIIERKEYNEANNIIEKIGYVNHPAVKMWIKHCNALKLYCNYCLIEHCNRKHEKVDKEKLYRLKEKAIFPWWIGNKFFHLTHKSRMLHKNLEFYSEQFNLGESEIKRILLFNNGEYFW